MTDNQQEDTVPHELQPELDKALERLQASELWAKILAHDPKVQSHYPRILSCSEYVADVLIRYPEAFLGLVESGRLHQSCETDDFQLLLAQELADVDSEDRFLAQVRKFRHRELVRIVWRDLCGWADQSETLADLSNLADACIRAALQYAEDILQHQHGLPRDESGEEAHFVVVAMGKLGGGELNFSSDVDLVFLFSGHGETDGDRSIANEEYFRKVARLFIDVLSRKTLDGFVYRVDARLRPFGDSGPLAVSVAAFEDYLLQHGRDWERYAWIKS
ncbi:MAG: bifunctional [glutamate--ammonia ligase]-adenylyl-L-tyrosine phosphorylase/[glutamate--ammonia-ligase] adenylyltransferase, partial [Gammaproteobacteria bacterium]